MSTPRKIMVRIKQESKLISNNPANPMKCFLPNALKNRQKNFL